jgi:hypothetical protein
LQVIRGLLAAVAVVLVCAPSALADEWLPHPADATWTYSWSDTKYLPAPITEKVTVGAQKGASFTLHWTTDGVGNPDGSISSSGDVELQESAAGLIDTDWKSSPPPPTFPVLCASVSGCNNSLSSTWYYLIWGTRSPVLAEPLLAGEEWTATGGGQGDVTSDSTYVGHEKVSVPAFSAPVTAAKVVSTVTQAGALGDPYGSGTRTVWWVHGVGPVKMTFRHAGGAGAPLTTSVLESTNQTPTPPPPDANWFPLRKGLALTYSWTNTKHLKKPAVEQFTVDDSATGSARFTVKSVSGPIKVSGTYGFSTRLTGITNLWGNTQAATTATFPALGPSSKPKAKRRHFFTPFDLMTFGFNPLLPAYATPKTHWRASTKSQDWLNFGVSGTTKILGVRKVKVKAGSYEALVVQSKLKQRGFPFGSGTRTCWFADGVGLVKLVFRHGDRSVSTVELTKTSG